MARKKELLEYTKDVWQPYYAEELSERNLIEISNNVIAALNLLIRWERAANKDLSIEESKTYKGGN